MYRPHQVRLRSNCRCSAKLWRLQRRRSLHSMWHTLTTRPMVGLIRIVGYPVRSVMIQAPAHMGAASSRLDHQLEGCGRIPPAVRMPTIAVMIVAVPAVSAPVMRATMTPVTYMLMMAAMLPMTSVISVMLAPHLLVVSYLRYDATILDASRFWHYWRRCAGWQDGRHRDQSGKHKRIHSVHFSSFLSH